MGKMKKTAALVMGIAFPLLHIVLQRMVYVVFYWVIYSIKRASSQGVSEEILSNQMQAALNNSSVWRVSVTALIFLLVSALLLSRTRKITLNADERVARINIISALPCLLLIGLGLYLTLDGLFKGLPVPREWVEGASKSASRLSAAGFSAQIIGVFILAPIAEEIAYRGLCLPYLRRGFALPAAVIFQAALFGFFHGEKLQMIYAFAAGLILGVVFIICGSVWAPIIVHMVFNGIGIVFMSTRISLHSGFWIATSGIGLILLILPLRYLLLKKPDCAIDT